jgi:hypothetical protein
MTHLTNVEIVETAKSRTPAAVEEVDSIKDYGCFTKEQFEQTIREDVLQLRAAKALEGMDILGFAMDIDNGVVKPLDI